MTTKNYQYGSSPENIVALTENQARAVNGFVFHRDESIEIERKNGKARLVGEIELPDDVTMDDYSSAADILNQFIADHGGSIECTEEYLKDHDILIEVN